MGRRFYHQVKLLLAGEMLSVMAGFSYDMPIPGLLGRDGFFDNFRVTFDPEMQPPGLTIERVRI